jgi:uncharacterized protein YjbI with pentapeptide repeats
MSEQDGTQATPLLRPANDDKEAWKAFWEQHGLLWRTEPEIDTKRQKFLAERRTIEPDIEKGIFPFKDMKLSRADVEWLLATHENGQRPVNWSDESQRERKGLDLRGADLRSLNLSGLPLAKMYGGGRYWSYGTVEQHEAVLAHFEGCSLVYAHLEGASLDHAYLEKADLSSAHLESADLYRANLEGAWLANAHLEGTILKEAHLEGASLSSAHLEGASLRKSYFNHATKLKAMVLGNEKSKIASIGDVHWGDVNLAVVKWSQVSMLGDEQKARQQKWKGQVKDRIKRLQEYEDAVRANRQLAVALQAQGLNEDAARFAYRAQRLQRVVLRKQRMFGSYLFSLFLDLLAGYGYRPGRSVFWYLVIIIGFALTYYTFGHITPLEAFILSLTSFHGRGFFPGTNLTLSDPRVILAAFEAVVGLLIEISFIATFTKRFFGS